MTSCYQRIEEPPGDADIRVALLGWLAARHRGAVDTAILEELGLCRGRVRVDVAVVNGVLHGYEIKSARDSLRRLAGQVETYGRVLDRATLVVALNHRDAVATFVPTWWEIQSVHSDGGSVRFTRLRRGTRNPARDPRAMVELLWLDDAMRLLDQRGGARGYRGKPARVVWNRVCELYDADEIAAAVRAQLKAREAPRCLRRRA